MDDGRAPRLFGKGRSWFMAAEGGWGKWRGLSTAGKHAAPGSTEGSRWIARTPSPDSSDIGGSASAVNIMYHIMVAII